jgi:alkaline phosphatase D
LEAVRQIRRTVEFTTADVNVEVCGLAKRNNAWIEPMNESSQRNEIQSTRLGDVQIILLDTRSFRDQPLKNPFPSWKNDYLPDTNPDKTILGAKQWAWLKERLQEPADLRVIGSSIQFGHEYNGWESWTNFPLELIKMVRLITETKANGVVFISGDVHWGELSLLKTPDCYPLHDLTASGLNRDWSNVEPNHNRHGDACMDFHFGMLEIDWEGNPSSGPSVQLRIHDMTGRGRVRKTVRLSDLKF